MKKNLFITAVLITFFSYGQAYIEATQNSSGAIYPLTHNGGLIMGQERHSNTFLNTNTKNTGYPLQIYTPNQNQSLGMLIGNGLGRWEITVAGSNGSYHPIATPGTAVLRKLGLNHNIIFNMGNNNSTDPNSNTTNWNSPDVFSITLNDQANYHTLKVYNTGKVTVGTPMYDNDSNYRLYVKDGIKTERVKVEVAVTNGWADYVFDEGYKLTPLNELEQFIKKFKHLPEVPSESEVLKDGIELKAMNILLLKKIEELTLYTIEQQKSIEEMRGEIKNK
jgi:hypothetical protein